MEHRAYVRTAVSVIYHYENITKCASTKRTFWRSTGITLAHPRDPTECIVICLWITEFDKTRDV